MDLVNTPEELVDKLRKGDRRSLSRLISCAESKRKEDRELVQSVLRLEDSSLNSIRLAVSGPPGVGKSTFINALTRELVSDFRVAILTIDPTSPISGGSILGDKTRMEDIVGHPKVFIRPSPSGKSQGGVAAYTSEVIRLCELAGFDFIIIETVGVGQNEITARHLSDHFLLVLHADGGDDLQGIKRGIMELADSFVFNKIDNTPGRILKKAVGDLQSALHLMRGISEFERYIYQVSSFKGDGVPVFLEGFLMRVKEEMNTPKWSERRTQQQQEQFTQLIKEELIRHFIEGELSEEFDKLRKRLQNSEITLSDAIVSFRELIN